MKHCNILLIVLALGLTSCAERKPQVVDRVVYKVQKVYIVKPCDVVVDCDFKGMGYEPTMKLLKCVVKQKRALEYCQQVGGDTNDHHKD